MNFTIAASRKDIAGMNIIAELVKLGGKLDICWTDKEIIYADEFNKLHTDFVIFASKHQSVKKIKTLTIHPVGNWKKADFGGYDSMICPTSALALKHFFQILDKKAEKLKDKYQISLEATHHGPLINIPCFFIEVGSSEEEWGDLEACRVVAQVIFEGIRSFDKRKNYKVGFGVGGPHYCPNFNEIQLGNNIALSHIVAEYGLPLNERMIRQIISKTQEKVECVVVDWKGLGNAEQRQSIMKLLEGFEVVRTDKAKNL